MDVILYDITCTTCMTESHECILYMHGIHTCMQHVVYSTLIYLCSILLSHACTDVFSLTCFLVGCLVSCNRLKIHYNTGESDVYFTGIEYI